MPLPKVPDIGIEIVADDGFHRVTEWKRTRGTTLFARIDGDFDWREYVAERMDDNPEIAVWVLCDLGDPERRLVHGFEQMILPVCRECHGSGKYVGFLLIEECEPCEGTGFDLESIRPAAILKRLPGG